MNRIEEAAISLRDGHAVEENSAVLWEYLAPRVRLFFLKRGLSPDSSKELTQEVFMRLFISIDTFRFEASIETWTFAIAENIWRNTLRDSSALKRQRQQVPLQELGDGDLLSPSSNELAVTVGDPLSTVLLKEQRVLVQESIAKLPSTMRRCVELRYGRELNNKEIAAILNISRATVSSLLLRRDRGLRRWFEIGTMT